MTSQIRVDEITNRSGLGTVTIYDNGFEFTGVTTFTENVDIEGNLTIGGVLTYEDTTNIDSVGVITARAGVHVTGGNLAVGHNNPSVNLHVRGSASNGQIYLGGTGAHSQIYADNDGVLILNADQGNSAANSYLGFNVDNTERLRIDSSGRVLIGRTTQLASSAERLTIDNGMAMFRRNSANAAALYIRNEDTTADTRQPYLIFTDGGGNRGGFGVQYNESSLWISGQNGIAFRTGGSAPSTTERVRIDSSGNLLLKTGEIDIQGGNKTVKTSAGFLQLGTSGSHHTAIITAGSERLRITSGGKILVGTTSSSGDHILEVNSGTDNEGIKVVSTDAGSYIRFADNSTTGSTRLGAVGDDFKIDVSSAERLRITSAGRVSISSDGTADGLLTIKGNSDETGTPSIRLLDGSDSREVSVSNSSGDFVVSTHGTDNNAHGQIKIFESGIISFLNGGASGSLTERLRISSDGQLAGLEPGGGAPQIINNADVNLGGRYIWNRISSSNNVTTTVSNQFRIAFYRSTSGGHTDCYYRGVNLKIHAGGRFDWGGHGFVTYVGELLMTFSSNTSGRTHIITNEGYSFLQNNSNNMRFYDTQWSYDSNYLYGTLRFHTNESGTGWKPYYNIEIIDTDGVVQSVTGV